MDLACMLTVELVGELLCHAQVELVVCLREITSQWVSRFIHGVFQSYVFRNRVGGGWWLNRGNYGISSLTGTSWFI